MSLGRDDSLWVASVNGICRIKDGEFRQWTQRDGLTDSSVNWVVEESDGTVWAALSGHGLARLRDNRIGNIRREDGLFDGNLQIALPDDQGRLWINSGLGLFASEKSNVDDFLAGKVDRVTCVTYESPDAVRPADTSVHEASACATADGRLWFPNGNGLVMVDPADIVTNAIAPPSTFRLCAWTARRFRPPTKSSRSRDAASWSSATPVSATGHRIRCGIATGWKATTRTGSRPGTGGVPFMPISSQGTMYCVSWLPTRTVSGI